MIGTKKGRCRMNDKASTAKGGRFGGESGWIQLATRIGRDTAKSMKLHCVRTDQTVMAFVNGAIEERLAKEKAGLAAKKSKRKAE